jgi:cytochrome c peroxidase
MIRILFGPLLVLVFVTSAAVLPPSRPAAKNILNLPARPYRYANVALPAHFTQPGRNDDNTPPDNPLSDNGATLGRVLFYDTRLSANNTTSCASCHVQAHAFADPKPFSKGFHGALTDRRAMPLVNLRYYQRARFFWDERAGNLEEMVLLPIQSRIEMGQDLTRVADTLARDTMYPGLFARAFGDRQITHERIGKALAQFVRSIVSYESRYDEGRARVQSAQDDFANFTLKENRGKALFMRNCSTCHMKDRNEHFFVPTPANTGLRRNDPTADGGIGDATLRAADLGSFKSPSLRNVDVTAPYGHDGRFATLDALIDHYSDNPIFDPNLGYMIPVGPLKFTASEKAALIAFLKTLTDERCLTDPRFSNPFVDRKDVVKSVNGTIRKAGAILKAVGAAPPQAPVVLRAALPAEMPPMPRVKSPQAVIERLASFDGNADHRISREELPERMQELLARGDRNTDATLDSDEIRSLVNAASSERIERIRLSFDSQSSTRSSEGLPGVIKDLKLPPEKHAFALSIVSRQKLRNGNGSANGELYGEMRALLDDEEYQNFVAATTRLSMRPEIIR